MPRHFLSLVTCCCWMIELALPVTSYLLPYRSSITCFAAASMASSLEVANSKSSVFTIDGMKCSGCAERIQSALRVYDPDVIVTLQPPQAKFSRPWSVLEVNRIISSAGNYIALSKTSIFSRLVSTVGTYAPLLGIFTSILAGTMGLQLGSSQFDVDLAMQHFMGLYFVVFSFFKMLNLNGFAESFRMYDLLASRSRLYAYVYPFIELVLGCLYLRNFSAYVVNMCSFLLMSFSSLGVLMALLQKRKIACACLGTFFNLPMSFVSLLEDLLMSSMALMALFKTKNFKLF